MDCAAEVFSFRRNDTDTLSTTPKTTAALKHTKKLRVSDIIVGLFREESQAKPGLHFLFEKTAGNKKSQYLVIVNAITSDLQRTKKFEADMNFLAESFDTGEGLHPFDFASVQENPVLRNLGGDSDIADRSFIELIVQKQFRSYSHLFGILEEKLETFRKNMDQI